MKAQPINSAAPSAHSRSFRRRQRGLSTLEVLGIVVVMGILTATIGKPMYDNLTRAADPNALYDGSAKVNAAWQQLNSQCGTSSVIGGTPSVTTTASATASLQYLMDGNVANVAASYQGCAQQAFATPLNRAGFSWDASSSRWKLRGYPVSFSTANINNANRTAVKYDCVDDNTVLNIVQAHSGAVNASSLTTLASDNTDNNVRYDATTPVCSGGQHNVTIIN